MDTETLLARYKKGKITLAKALAYLKDLPYKDMGFARLDHHRMLRRGHPEVVFGKGKTVDQIVAIAKKLIGRDGKLLVTHAPRAAYRRLKGRYPSVRYEPLAKILYLARRVDGGRPEKAPVVIVTAGTADIPVALEAKVTLEVMGESVETLFDVGVAGLHRLLDKRHALERAGVIIVVAGMEGALASVVSGLVSKPVVAVPTSVGYGASFKGIAPLLTMLNSCSPGVAVVNIDNGFGAGYFAGMINR